ncbi:MAG: PEP-CTERM sorting domain-containing protein [Cyanobacteria bacterium P01_D01_bin.56]
MLKRKLGKICLLLASVLTFHSSAEAAIITFDEIVEGSTTFEFDGDNDGTNDIVFTTTDPLGFRTIGPGDNQTFVAEPGLEGTSLLDVDLRVDFFEGASENLSFGFSLNSSVEDPSFSTNFAVFDSSGTLLGSETVAGAFTQTPAGISTFPEGELSLNFPGIASYAEFDFTSEFGRYIIDDFAGTFGSTEDIEGSVIEAVASVPEPSNVLALLALASFGMAYVSRSPLHKKLQTSK